MKISRNSFNIMSTVGGMVGGIGAKMVENFTKSEDQENNYVTIAVQAVAGSAMSAFLRNDLLKSAGAGIVGVAGYNLAKELGIGDDSSESKTSGVGLLPEQMAIAGGVGRMPMRYSRRIRGTETETKTTSNVQ